MVERDRADSKRHLWRAFGLLCTGCVVLLCTKLAMPPLWDTVLCVVGGGMLLYANGEFLFGLLIHANIDETAPSELPPTAPQAADSHAASSPCPAQGATPQQCAQSALKSD